MLEDFRRIAETATPQPIQSRLVTPDEARAVLTSFNRLTDPMRSNFMTLPVDNIIEFSVMQTKKRPSLHNYMTGVTEAIEPPTPEAELDHLDKPDVPPTEPVVERIIPKKRTRKPVLEAEPPAEQPKPSDDESRDRFFTHLTERLEHLVNQTPAPQSIVVETTDHHVERLVEIEQSMLGTMEVLIERVARYESQYTDTQSDMRELLGTHRTMLTQITESQAQISVTQKTLVETQVQIVKTISLLAEKVMLFTQTPPVVNPVVNIPAPIVNVTMQEGRRTKIVERDENNLISKIIEGYED